MGIDKIQIITPKNKLVSIDSRQTYEEALLGQLDKMTLEQKQCKVNQVIIIWDGDHGEAFSVLESSSMVELIGLIELIKIFIATDPSED